ncbi:MAG: S8 family peptidase [Lachnospiraceae bacterium]|nr:S8 family peptidase [Lachnospiraceae bacterium]
MDDTSKFENLLNLAIDATPSERERSLNLGVGYEQQEQSWELIVKYSGSLSGLAEAYPQIAVQELINEYAILRVPQDLLPVISGWPQIEYVEKPKRLFFAVEDGVRASCIMPVQGARYGLTGKNVICAYIDSGIDYAHPDFRNEDGSTRILNLWDQTLGREFDSQEINEALQAETITEQYRLVPSRDTSGHGTHVAGIGSGNGRASQGTYRGVAYESDLLVVKLGTPQTDSFPRTTELMTALDYVIRKAQEYEKPVAVNLSFGNTYGSHSGTSLLETFIDDISNYGKSVIIIGSGNEGNGRGHTSGTLPDLPGTTEGVELAVGDYEPTVNVQLWKSYVDEFDIYVRHPSRAWIGPLYERAGAQRYVLGDTELLIYYGEPSPYSVYQEIYFDFLPRREYIDSGVWHFYLVPRRIVTGNYDLWLPSMAALGNSTGFLLPTPETTLTIPATADRAITVGAYDARFRQLAEFSGRGYTRQTMQVKPDLVAPGVAITSCAPGGGYSTRSGTSMATPFVTGSSALLMQWAIVQGNDPFLYDAVIIGLSGLPVSRFFYDIGNSSGFPISQKALRAGCTPRGGEIDNRLWNLTHCIRNLFFAVLGHI